MKGTKDFKEERRRGLIGIYALSMMEKSGPIHGYLVSERIATRTDGAWRPGPGAVYPSLLKLVERGLAKRKRKGVRQEYEITEKGKAQLVRIRSRNTMSREARLDLTPLFAEIMGSEDVGMFRLFRLRRTLDSLEFYLSRNSGSSDSVENLRKDVINELTQSLERLSRGNLATSRKVPKSRKR